MGTDISFKMEGRPALIGDGLATEPGEADFFPGVPIAGNIPPGQLVREPAKCYLEQGKITA